MMEFDADAIITCRDIDAMADEELLPFARKHSLLLGERFGRPESFYAPELLDDENQPELQRLNAP